MPKLYHEEGGWAVPGTQSRRALRVDIPSTPFELAVWLNARHVQPHAWAMPDVTVTIGVAQLPGEDELQLADQARAPRVPGFCDACGQSAAGKLKLSQGQDVDQVLAWADTAELWQLERVAEGIREHVRALGEQLAERSVQ